MTIDEEV